MLSEYIMTDDKWHFEKTVNVGHIATTIVIAISAFWFFSDMQQAIKSNSQRIDFLELQRAEDRKSVEKRLDKIESKIDRLLESQFK